MRCRENGDYNSPCSINTYHTINPGTGGGGDGGGGDGDDDVDGGAAETPFLLLVFKDSEKWQRAALPFFAYLISHLPRIS